MHALLHLVRQRAAPAAHLARPLSTLRDFAAKTMLRGALDSFSAPRAPRPADDAAESPPLRADIEYDALTWKSIVVRGPEMRRVARARIFLFRGPLRSPPRGFARARQHAETRR